MFQIDDNLLNELGLAELAGRLLKLKYKHDSTGKGW